MVSDSLVSRPLGLRSSSHLMVTYRRPSRSSDIVFRAFMQRGFNGKLIQGDGSDAEGTERSSWICQFGQRSLALAVHMMSYIYQKRCRHQEGSARLADIHSHPSTLTCHRHHLCSHGTMAQELFVEVKLSISAFHDLLISLVEVSR